MEDLIKVFKNINANKYSWPFMKKHMIWWFVVELT